MQYLACDKATGLNRQIIAVNVSGIAHGYLLGCTGTKIMITLLNEMKKRGMRKDLATLFAGSRILFCVPLAEGWNILICFREISKYRMDGEKGGKSTG